MEESELEEERRLAYVGITRAEESLYLTNAFSRTLYGRTQYNRPSRFVEEIDQELLDIQGMRPTPKKAHLLHQKQLRQSTSSLLQQSCHQKQLQAEKVMIGKQEIR